MKVLVVGSISYNEPQKSETFLEEFCCCLETVKIKQYLLLILVFLVTVVSFESENVDSVLVSSIL